MGIHLTQAQARAVATLAEREGELTLHQLVRGDESAPQPEDVFVTPIGEHPGFRVGTEGNVDSIGKTLPSVG